MNFVKHVKTKLRQDKHKGGDIPIIIEADGKEAEEIVNALLRREGSGDAAKQQTVTIPLESYAQMLRSHTQLETLRVAWENSRGDLVWLLLRTMFGEEPRGDSDAE